jgi:hypothetical protein
MAGWWDTDWTYRQKITIDKDKVPSNQSNFPVFVDLSDMDAAFHTNVKSDGGDIRVTLADGTTQVPLDMVEYNAGSDTGEIHFLGVSISSSVDTDFYIYYGNAAASKEARGAANGGDNVWDGSFDLVYHMNEDPSGGAPQMNDSTSNVYHGTTEGSMTSGDLVPAVVGNGLDTDGVDDAIQCGSFKATSASGTLMMMYKGGNNTANEMPMGQNGSSDGTAGCGLFATGGGQYTFWLNNVNKLTVDGAALGVTACVSVTWTAGATKSYFNGSLFSSGSGGAPSNNTQSFFIAGFNYSAGTILEHDGNFDEIRISSTDRSADWNETECNNLRNASTFYSFSSQEIVPDPANKGFIVWM